MNKWKQALWYIGVILACIGLFYAFVTKSWILAIVCAGVTAVLKIYNNKVEIPKVYRDHGLENDMFGSGGRMNRKHEEDNK